MKITISCQDKYEAKKLSSLIYLKDNKETFITQILNIVETEVVVLLKDKSAHSIILKNSDHVEIFADFIQSVLEKEHKIIVAKVIEDEVEIIKE